MITGDPMFDESRIIIKSFSTIGPVLLLQEMITKNQTSRLAGKILRLNHSLNGCASGCANGCA
jgi:hypothetical protein